VHACRSETALGCTMREARRESFACSTCLHAPSSTDANCTYCSSLVQHCSQCHQLPQLRRRWGVLAKHKKGCFTCSACSASRHHGPAAAAGLRHCLPIPIHSSQRVMLRNQPPRYACNTGSASFISLWCIQLHQQQRLHWCGHRL
jgi:hypothetical protein